MTRDDINYWLSPRFNHAPPSDEELTRGRPISKRMLAVLLANDIKKMVERGFALEQVGAKVDQLARMVRDDPEPQSADDQTHER